MDVLSPIIGETAAQIVILAAVLLLLAALALLIVGLALRIFRGRGFGLRGSRNRAPRLSVPDVMPVDSRRKLVLIRRDQVEHLLLVGGATDLVIEQNIQRGVQPANRPRTAPQVATAPANGATPTQPSPAQPMPVPVQPMPGPMPRRSAVPGASTPQRPPGRETAPARPASVAAMAADAPAAPLPAPSAAAAPPIIGFASPPRPSSMQPPGGFPLVAPAANASGPATDGGRPSAAASLPRSERDNAITLPLEPEPFAGAIPVAPPRTQESVPTEGAPKGRTGLNGADETLGEEMAALMPAVVAESRGEPGPNTAPEAAPTADGDGEKAARVNSRENEMAQLLGEIFGKP